MTNFSLIAIAFILFICFGQASAQEREKVSTPEKTEAVVTSSSVEITEDRFSGKRKFRLAKQKITSVLTLELSVTIDLDAPAITAQQWSSEYVGIKFTFGAGASSGSEFNFIVDGKRVKGGNLKYLVSPLHNDRGFYIGSITVGSLEKIANGSEVEMKLGNEVYSIGEFARKNIKAFIAALKRN